MEKIDWRLVWSELLPDAGIHILFENRCHHPDLLSAQNRTNISFSSQLLDERVHFCRIVSVSMAQVSIKQRKCTTNELRHNKVSHQINIIRYPKILHEWEHPL